MFKSFLAIALVLSAHYKSFIVQAVPTPLQLLSTEKQCEFKTATSFITRSTKAKLFGNKKTNMEIKAEMTTLLQAVKPHPADRLLDADIFQPELYYRMGIYTAMTYCDSKESVQKISGLALNTTASGKLDLPLYTGNFSILSYQNQATKIVDSKKDSLYIVYRNDLQKSIILSWRGSVSIEDFIADADSSKVKQGYVHYLRTQRGLFIRSKTSFSLSLSISFSFSLHISIETRLKLPLSIRRLVH